MIPTARPIRIRMIVPALIAAILFTLMLSCAASNPKLGANTDQQISQHISEYILTDEDISALSALQNFDRVPPNFWNDFQAAMREYAETNPASPKDG